MKALRLFRPRAFAVAAAALIPLVGLVAPASAASFTVTFACQANAPIVGPQAATFTQNAEVTAPATVAPGGSLAVVIDPAVNTVPATVSGYTVKNINTFALKIPIPANSTYVSSTLTGGSGLGSAAPKITVASGVATLSFSDPISGGATFELPTVTVNLKAGTSGTIQTKLAGTSYTSPGLTFNTVVNVFFDITAPTACYPNPSPVFTTTTIG